MADHPAIVVLAKVIQSPHFSAETREREWNALKPAVKHFLMEQARAAYAAVLRDLMEPSNDGVLERNVVSYLRARAREIGVEVE